MQWRPTSCTARTYKTTSHTQERRLSLPARLFRPLVWFNCFSVLEDRVSPMIWSFSVFYVCFEKLSIIVATMFQTLSMKSLVNLQNVKFLLYTNSET